MTEIDLEKETDVTVPDDEKTNTVGIINSDNAAPTDEHCDSPALDCESEIASIKEALPGTLVEIKNLEENERYRELRLLGLSPKEAYLATAPQERQRDSRSHLTGGFPKAASAPSCSMSSEELNMARSLFEDLDEREIRKLYKKVTK